MSNSRASSPPPPLPLRRQFGVGEHRGRGVLVLLLRVRSTASPQKYRGSSLREGQMRGRSGCLRTAPPLRRRRFAIRRRRGRALRVMTTSQAALSSEIAHEKHGLAVCTRNDVKHEKARASFTSRRSSRAKKVEGQREVVRTRSDWS